MGKKRGKKTLPIKESRSLVKAKKYLGQHFLKEERIAQQIAATLTLEKYHRVLEIGPGTGVLTKHLLLRGVDLIAMDVDKESITYLNHIFFIKHAEILKNNPSFQVIEGDFLKFNLNQLFQKQPFAIIGNFPYNISTQIVFKVLAMRHQIPEFSGMFQKEVAKRICEPHGTKIYGILSVLVQAFYEAEYLFTVHPQVFEPPPKVQSGVLRLRRKDNYQLKCDEEIFFKVVKMAFNQRRKTIRNSLKSFKLSTNLKEDTIFEKRPEQLSVKDFVVVTQMITNDSV